MRSVRLVFDAEALWSHMERSGVDAGHSDYPFAFMGCGSPRLSRVDLDWVCDRLIVEVRAPASSFDLTEPAEAEALLLRRVREDVGAGMFPNVGRSAVDVAAAMIGIAQSARQAGSKSPPRRSCGARNCDVTSVRCRVRIRLTGRWK